ncbi:MAG: alpha/beta hydrolase [Actinomycetota bacterium]
MTPGDVPDIMAMMAARAAGEAVTAPYTFSDMAADAIGLLDHLEIDTAHVVGASLGGMIVQTMAIEHPDRVASVTSIMSTTGADGVGQPEEAAIGALLAPPPSERDAAIAHNVEVGRTISGPLFDETEAFERSRETFDRSFRPAAAAFQLAAMGASGDRTERLASVDCPALVIHGRVDPLVTLSGGLATAEAIPGADLMVLSDMGHDLPAVYWPQMADAIIGVARRADEATAHHG